jgi:hypothetical protein
LLLNRKVLRLLSEDAPLTLDKGRVPVQWKGGGGLPAAGTLLVLWSSIKKGDGRLAAFGGIGGMYRDEPML